MFVFIYMRKICVFTYACLDFKFSKKEICFRNIEPILTQFTTSHPGTKQPILKFIFIKLLFTCRGIFRERYY